MLCTDKLTGDRQSVECGGKGERAGGRRRRGELTTSDGKFRSTLCFELLLKRSVWCSSPRAPRSPPPARLTAAQGGRAGAGPRGARGQSPVAVTDVQFQGL
ncbi:hypothetical protein RR46_05538 [Papilio xuthus]|uniref:Uncharacterized protein n=1 Tax=Papilio xuthus TaxID=66420 RepID=A0A194Q2X8_PAPXU|nr:hypothetical protein RR46_05538 [Papilio xuthus]